MIEISKRFDWPGFMVREVPVLILTVVWLIQRFKRHDGPAYLVVYGLLFVLMTYFNYRRARRV
jgi:hypothetical protein